MDYYHSLITDKSWKLLQSLRHDFDFILVGGWAVFLYTKALKSKDIDLVLNYNQLEKMRESFDVYKNDRLKKYEAKKGEMDIDIYTYFYSNPGIPAEEIEKFKVSVSGFNVPKKEILAVLKIKAFTVRMGSIKGKKDLIDIVSLLSLPGFDGKVFNSAISVYSLTKELEIFREALDNTFELKEINLNIHKMAKVKKEIIALLGE